MFSTCLSSIAVLLFLIICSKYLYKDSKCAVTAITFSFVYLILNIGLIGAVLTLLHQFVGLTSISVGLLVIDLVFGILVFRDKETHKRMHSDRQMWLGAFLVIAFIGVIAIWHFGIKLKLIYIDIDSARYFKQAMDIRRTGKISGEYLSPLILSMCIQWISPFVREVSVYKGMIFGHIGVQMISAAAFYCLAELINKGKFARTVNVIITILYVSGYQLYILVYGTFFHWQDGTLILMFLIYHILKLQKSNKEMVFETFSILLGIFGLIVCYPFYLIMTAVLLIPEGIRWIHIHYRRMNVKVKLLIPLIGIAAILLGAVFARQRIDSVQGFVNNLQADGLSYREPFLDFIYFVPFLIAYVVLRYKRKVEDEYSVVFRLNLTTIVFIVAWFIMYTNKWISTYYYYRNYYIVWLVMWLTVAHVIQLLAREKQTLFVGAYAAMYAVAVLTSVVGVNKLFANVDEGMFLTDKTTQTMCPLYAFNIQQLVVKPPAAVSDEIFEGYNYIVTELNDEPVRMLTSYFSFMQTHWFMGVTDVTHENEFNNVWYSSVYDILQNVDIKDAKYLFVLKTDATWMQYYDDVLCKANIVYENPECMIITKPDHGTWVSLVDDYMNSDDPMVQLLAYMGVNYAPSHFRLLSEDEESKECLNASRIFGKEEADDYLDKVTADNFMDLRDMFTEDQIDGVAMRKDSEIYIKNKAYFDTVVNVYENDGAILVGPGDAIWNR